MKKGEIYYGRKKSLAIHPIIFLEAKNSDYFIGAMITHANAPNTHVPMKVEHFKKVDENETRFELQYDSKTHLVKAKLLKKNEWEPFRKIGELTNEGIDFVENIVKKESEKIWEDFISGK
jgi:hypothetical protein